MPRYFIRLSYNGTRYHGWQIQPNAITVQQEITTAISLLLRHDVEITGCGRTDTGVHAECFFAHMETAKELTSENQQRLCNKLNAFLSDDIAIEKIFPVADDTHARFSAISRTYEYRITQQKQPFLQEFAHFFPLALDIEKMNRCARLLMEYRDFSCFSKSHTQTHTNDCSITEAQWQFKNNLLVFKISADRFLRNMVRAIVGTLVDAGLGKIDENDIHQIIQSGIRSKAGKSMPARGLFLTDVGYPAELLTCMRD